MSLPVTLKVFQDDALIATQHYDREVIKIGRLPSAHLRLDDAQVARIHTVLEVDAEGTLHLVDMGSEVGTFLNGKRVEKSPVAFGDVLMLGTTRIEIHRATERAAVNLAHAVQAQPVPEAPRRARYDGPLGVAAHFLWGRQRVGEFFLRPGAREGLSIGSGAGVDFVLDAPELRSSVFRLVQSDGDGFSVRLTDGMRGSLSRGAEQMTVASLIAGGLATPDGEGAYVLALGKHDRLRLLLGGVNVELSLEPVPAAAWLPWQETMDFAAVNVFLVLFFLGALFVIAATNRNAEGDRWVDELNAESRQVKLIIDAVKLPPSNPHFDRLAGLRKNAGATPAPAARGKMGKIGRPNAPKVGGASGEKPDPKLRALAMLEQIMPGGNKPIGGLFTDSVGNKLHRALADVHNGLGDTAGNGGLNLRGDGTGGGGHGSVGIVGSITSMGGTATGDRVRPGFMGGKKSDSSPTLETTPIEVSGIDPELIRRVIHSHRDQVRYCYELELNRFPSLSGKVKVRFVITDNGTVRTSDVAESTVGNAGLERCIAGRVKSWLFPTPKGGGIAVVSYPFVFRPSGD